MNMVLRNISVSLLVAVGAAPPALSQTPDEQMSEQTQQAADLAEPEEEVWTPPDLNIDTIQSRPQIDLVRGAELYRVRCAACHGPSGRGDGAAARFMDPKPRDLVSGTYKLRSTATGELPTDSDLYRTVSRGIRGTGMPGWSGLQPEDRWQLVEFLKSLSPRFVNEEPGAVVPMPAPIAATPELIARGGGVYMAMKCGECHGMAGRGDGPAAWTLKDDDQKCIYPFDMTRGWRLKGGPKAVDIVRTLLTGLDGTPMPSYNGTLSDRDTWALAHYITSFYQDEETIPRVDQY